MLGNKSSGKSSIASSIFNQNIYGITIGGFYNSVEMTVKGQNLKIRLQDKGAEEKFKFLLSFYYGNANASIIVFEITQNESF